jgi:uncharacterized protein (UPF0276 family)
MVSPKGDLGAAGAGVGLRLPHLQELVATLPAARWVEIHPENFLANPHATELLLDARRAYPISLHTVGVSIGSADGIDRGHLLRVRALVDRLDPCLVSGHLAWSTHQGEYLNDLLPLPYDAETLRLLAEHIDEVQSGLGRRYLVENPSSYFGFVNSTMTEVEFLGELAERTGCGLLCDISNVYVSAHNMGFDPCRYIDELPVEAVGELHLGGFTAEPDGPNSGADILIDTHAARVADPVWALYAHAVRRFGAKPTLIEWDNDIPAFATLLDEAMRADQVMAHALASEPARAAAC